MNIIHALSFAAGRIPVYMLVLFTAAREFTQNVLGVKNVLEVILQVLTGASRNAWLP